MSKQAETKTVFKDGTRYVVQRENDELVPALLGSLLGISSILALVYGVASYSRPDMVAKALENKAALFSTLIGAVIVLMVLVIKLSTLGQATFEKVSDTRKIMEFQSPMSFFAKALLSIIGVVVSEVEGSDPKKVQEEDRKGALSNESSFCYGAVESQEAFPAYVSSILKSLSAYATSSEVTATKLLDKGVAFMAGGLIFYVVAIVIWQVFANLTHPDPHVMYVGMAACSMTFIVVEFLAAWFLKQYRYYVEVSLSCLRVRSVYDRYLLGYYALREFNEEGDEKSRNQLVDILKEDVNWPSYKGAVSNDFNYMVESLGAAHATMDKMKSILGKKKTKAKPD